MVGLFLQSGYALLPSQPHHRVSSRLTRNLILFVARQGSPLNGPNTTFWPIKKNDVTIGKVTSAIYSPRLKQNIALAMVSTEHASLGSEVEVANMSGAADQTRTERAVIVERPFYDPQKKIAAS